MYVAFLVASHLLSLALAIYTTRASGVRADILLYAFLIDYLLRLITIQTLHSAISAGRDTFVLALAPLVSRPPRLGQSSRPVTVGEHGPPARLPVYLLAMAAFTYFAFVLMNVDADKQIDLAKIAGLEDLKWAALIGVIYWANALLTRTVVIHPDEPITRNFGYNSRELTVLALAVLTGAVVVAVRQEMNLDASAWTVMGPLLGYRCASDLSASLEGRRAG